MHVHHTVRRFLGLSTAGLAVACSLVACSALQAPPSPVVYDFGPGAVQASAAAVKRQPLVLGDMDATGALESTAMWYRLAYSDAQQLRPYAQARWSMAPGLLVRQRLRERVGRDRTVVHLVEAGVAGRGALTLRVTLEEFSQVFDTAQHSQGWIRLRATLSQREGTGERQLAQRAFEVHRDSTSADAAGGVRALTQATDAVIAEVNAWLQDEEAAWQHAAPK